VLGLAQRTGRLDVERRDADQPRRYDGMESFVGCPSAGGASAQNKSAATTRLDRRGAIRRCRGIICESTIECGTAIGISGPRTASARRRSGTGEITHRPSSVIGGGA
jgi:hypothetical protein